MSLLSKKKKTEERGELTTEAALLEKQREKLRVYQKENRKRHLDLWNSEKALIDTLDSEGASKYIKNCIDQELQHETRVGLHSMKINRYEYALIKKALEITEAKSSRELYIKMCKEILEGSLDKK